MYLLYVDESGLVSDAAQQFYVLGGVAVFEREPHWIEQALNEIAMRFRPQDPDSIELHGNPMRSGKGMWRRISPADREQAIMDALDVGIRQRYPKNVRLFGVALHKQRFAGQDIVQVAFEQLSSRFDQFLGRLHKQGNTQRGLIVFDKCSTERRIQTLAREFKRTGHTFGITRNFADIPVFVDSDASRLIQLADLVAYSLFRHFEHDDSKFYDVISHCFDSEGGVIHGLYTR